MFDFPQFMQWAFLGLISGGVYVLWQMKESLTALNSKVEVMLVEHRQAKEEIGDHEGRIRFLESKK